MPVEAPAARLPRMAPEGIIVPARPKYKQTANLHILYICARYPTIRQTFVAREMEQLALMGHQLTISVLRPSVWTRGPAGLELKQARVLRPQLTPWSLAQTQRWCMKHHFPAWKKGWQEVWAAMREVKPGGRILHLPYILTAAHSLAARLRDAKVDHIRAHCLASEALAARWLAAVLDLPYSLTAHTVSIDYPQAIMAKAVQGAAFMVGDTSEACNFAVKMHPKEIHLVRNGLNFNDFLPRTSLPPHDSEKIILAVGALIDKKGFDILLEALGLLKHRGVACTCRIIGEGPERLRLARRARALGLDKLVDMPGARSFFHLKEEYSQATVFVMPSKDSPHDSDGLPTVLIESMALGIPVVATRKGGIPDLITHGETGLLAPPNDPESLATCLSTLLNQQNLRHTLAAAGRKKVEKEYDIRQSARKILDLIKACGGG
jgi:colanic acid/amylovoran biosynthesis glycosyltransferase